VFLDVSHPISAHIEQSKPPEYLARQIAKAPKALPTPTWPTDDGIDR
jgi:hypothetical protein